MPIFQNRQFSIEFDKYNFSEVVVIGGQGGDFPHLWGAGVKPLESPGGQQMSLRSIGTLLPTDSRLLGGSGGLKRPPDEDW